MYIIFKLLCVWGGMVLRCPCVFVYMYMYVFFLSFSFSNSFSRALWHSIYSVSDYSYTCTVKYHQNAPTHVTAPPEFLHLKCGDCQHALSGDATICHVFAPPPPPPVDFIILGLIADGGGGV